MKLLYLANIRIPTEKAHGLQIMQMCEAFAQAGVEVTLIVPRRFNNSDMKKIKDIWNYFGVDRIFRVERIVCIDLFPLGKRTEKFAFYLESLTYTVIVALMLIFRRADVYYTRDPLTVLILSVLKPQNTLYYEAHQLLNSLWSRTLQTMCVKRAGTTIAVTEHLKNELTVRGAYYSIVAHDGFQTKRFSNLLTKMTARTALQIPTEAFIIGYIGRLHTMNMSKGIDKLIDAIARTDRPIFLCIVGGPEDMAEMLRCRWLECGLPSERFLSQGHVEPSKIPIYLAALDACAMPFPDTEHFRYYMSPLKLFEYMAAGRAIVSSDLPSVREVLQNNQNGILVPPDDVPALANGLIRLYDDPTLCERLGEKAKADSDRYSWQSRAVHILNRVPE